MISFVLASHNQHKVDEIREITRDLNISISSLSDLNIHDEIIEDGVTLDDNAWIKADYLFNLGHQYVIADDTGLEVYALDGAPGVYSARYAGSAKNSEANMTKLLNALSNCDNRDAQFRTSLAVYMDGVKHSFEGVIRGRIAVVKTGEGGFGYDPIFIPEGYEDSFGVLSSEIKNEISHRGRALQSFKTFLLSNLENCTKKGKHK